MAIPNREVNELENSMPFPRFSWLQTLRTKIFADKRTNASIFFKILNCVGFGVFVLISFRLHDTWAAASLIFVPLGALEVWLKTVQTKQVQQKRDSAASAIYRLVMSGDYSSWFSLYLRPFAVTNVLLSRASTRTSPLLRYLSYKIPDFEEILANALANNSPLVALGRPGESIGAGRLPTDEAEWKKVIIMMFSKCNRIFLIPGYQEGTLWEIKAVQEMNLLQKVIFVMPIGYHPFNVAAHWKKTQAALEQLSIFLPPYSNRGLLFTINADGNIETSKPLWSKLGSDAALRKTIADFMLSPTSLAKTHRVDTFPIDLIRQK